MHATRFSNSVSAVNAFAGDILADCLTDPFEAFNVVDREGTLRYLSPDSRAIFRLAARGSSRTSYDGSC
jgi:hypothetical protein